MASKAEYLSGNGAAIKNFIDKFDVRLQSAAKNDPDKEHSISCSTAMVRQSKALIDGFTLRARSRGLTKLPAEIAQRIGVLWSGDHLFEGTVETLEKLKSHGKKIVFVTNNSTKSRADYQKKLTGMGIPATIDEVFSSSYSSSIYISRILALPPDRRTVFVIGEAGIEAELSAESLRYIGGTDPTYQRTITPADYSSLADGSALDPSVGVVLCGLDFHLSYLKLAYAYHYLTQRGAVFLTTNSDVTLPSNQTVFPGAGACAAPLVAALGGRQPETLGKPSQKMMDAVAERFEFERARACMVGDRLNTDIRFGIEGGLGATLCVLTGVTKGKEEWEGDGDDVVRPSAWVDKLSDLRAGL